MQIDRSTQARLNAFIGLLLLLAIGGLAWVALSQGKSGSMRGRLREDSVYREAIRRGSQAERAGNSSLAESSYLSAQALRPDRADPKIALARVLVSQGKKKEAWEIYRGVFQDRDAKSPMSNGAGDARAWYADLESSYGDQIRAEQFARSVLPRAWSEAPKGSTLFAWAHMQGTQDVASRNLSPLGHLKRAMEIAPNWVLPHLGFAQLRLEANDPTDAEAEYATAKRLARKGTWRDWMMLIRFNTLNNRQAEAVAVLKEGARLATRTETDAWDNFHLMAVELGQPDLAAKALDIAALSISPNDGARFLSLSYTTEGERALELTERALQATTPRQFEVRAQIASRMYGFGKGEKAVAILKQSLPFADAVNRQQFEREIVNYQTPLRRVGGGVGFPGVPPSPSIPATFAAWLGRELAIPILSRKANQ